MLKKKTAVEDIDIKAREFAAAIEKYNNLSLYLKFETFIAITIAILQLLSLFNLIQTYHYSSSFMFIALMIISYLATDFFNGLVHMIVDNNTKYASLVGPFIAAFHMHHYKLRYIERRLITLYFNESGHKIWLAIYLVFLTLSQHVFILNGHLNFVLVSFGILSSFAELSHYWCHNPSKSRVITFLQKKHILLSFKHHRLHHLKDNINYAFLNGMTDPLLNIIAKTYYKGYKNRSDKHVSAYIKNKDIKI